MFSVKFSTLLVSICTAILSFIGVSCSNEEEMYGTPTADFEVKGIVTSESDNAPVCDAIIKVLPDMSDEYDIMVFSKTVTDERGNYSTTGTIFPLSSVKVACVPINSDLHPDTVVVKLEYIKYSDNSEPWYEDKAKVEVNFCLKQDKL
ncbi:MAG: radical SAM-associated putative lipoprotein [Muribaculaceae bacterium]|nr:hypothetical protein [Bacteroides sp.]MDE6803477.1 radical SAM-associated putative lipoprotein [Muribaculaceae bacterium]MDE7189665.1 radical SAM-associated putative lipoprotein [Muribaculaceae bacterium]